MARAKAMLSFPQAVLATSAIAAASFGISGCSKSPIALTATTAAWEKQLGFPEQNKPWTADVALFAKRSGRSVAEDAPKCLKDRLASPTFLRQEATRLERERSSVAVQGKWREKDLSKDLASFPPTQALYLSKHGDWIATEKGDPASCNDLPCILNQPYGNSQSDNGWKIYSFFLRMGYGISVRNFVPQRDRLSWSKNPNEVPFPNASFEDFLFTDEQLYSFWKLSYLLPDAYKNMAAFTRMHRVPPVQKKLADGSIDLTPAADPMAWGENICARSHGSNRNGVTYLRQCLDENNGRIVWEGDDPSLKENGITGIFYVTVTHELAHALDRNLAKLPSLEDRPSFSKRWLDFSGWRRETVFIPLADYAKRHPLQGCLSVPMPDTCKCVRSLDNPNQCMDDTMVPDPEKEGFVRTYAQQEGPDEDFAESAAYVRFRPDYANQRIPAKTAYLSELIYGGRTFDEPGLDRYYEDFTAAAVSPQILELVNGCLSSAGATTGENQAGASGSSRLALERALPAAAQACIERGLDERMAQAFDTLRATEWEACDLLGRHEEALRSRLYARLSPEVSRSVSESLERAPILLAISQLRTDLGKKADSREGYIQCYLDAQPTECYEKALNRAFEHVAEPYVGKLGEFLEQERQNFLAQYPYSQTAARMNQFYRLIFAGADALVIEAAEARWQACLGVDPNPSNVEMPLVEPYTGGTQYVAAGLLNCINSAYPEDISAARDRYLALFQMAVPGAGAQALVQSLLLPVYLDALRAKQAAAVAAEELERAQRRAGVVEVLAGELGANLEWMGDANTPELAVEHCDLVAEAAFDAYFGRVHPNQQLPTRFASMPDLRTAWSHEACLKVTASPVAKRSIEKRAGETWQSAMKALDGFVAQRARDQATDCIARFRSKSSKGKPGNGKTTKAQRRECLTGDKSWSLIETQALVDWDQSAEGRSQRERRQDANAYLQEQRTRLQVAAIRKMESR